MKNCLSGGAQMGTHMRITKKQPSQARIKKLLAKKAKKAKYAQNPDYSPADKAISAES